MVEIILRLNEDSNLEKLLMLLKPNIGQVSVKPLPKNGQPVVSSNIKGKYQGIFSTHKYFVQKQKDKVLEL
ncbi:MAG: hypothetical protein LBJ25_08600 [Candidatus Margulisbacteria bacterium]|jgi:hypothetical protein|nr:hypothetical protein [Candidatus Margulisiibacteriota bacterium]